MVEYKIRMSIFSKLFKQPKTAEEIADAVIYNIGKDAFVHVRDKEFKRLLASYPLSKEQKELVGVDLEISGVVYAYLLLENLEEHVEHSTTKESFCSIRNALIDAFVRYIKKGKTGGPLKRDMLVQVISMRCRDCRKEFERHKHELKPEDLKRNYWTEFCANDCLNHFIGNFPNQETDVAFYDNLARWNMRLGNIIQQTILDNAKTSYLKI
jgi:hypothetical protein